MINSRSEKRRDPRLSKSLPLKISTGEFDVVTETANISGSGAYCKVDRYIEPMTKLKILMLLPIHSRNKIVNKKVECEGVVVRTETVNSEINHYNVAVFFSNISNKDKKIVSDFVSHQLQKVGTN